MSAAREESGAIPAPPASRKGKRVTSVTAAAAAIAQLSAATKKVAPEPLKPSAAKRSASSKSRSGASSPAPSTPTTTATEAAAVAPYAAVAPPKANNFPSVVPVADKAGRALKLDVLGVGSATDPFRQPIRSAPNASGCIHCYVDKCECVWFTEQLEAALDAVALKRITEVASNYSMCAKSIYPPFVTRLAQILKITSKDTFYDLGSGNGSVVFQVAYQTGARCVAVELSEHNLRLSRLVWESLKPVLEKKAKKPMPEIEFIHASLEKVIMEPSFLRHGPNITIWTANLLMPRSVTHLMSERFRDLAPGARIAAFDDIWPHHRSLARIRDPDAFEKFDMFDYQWPKGSVEWTYDEGAFFAYVRRQS